MTDRTFVDSFERQGSKEYDAYNSKLQPISQNLLFLSGLVLSDLPTDARVLCVGVGTGIEIVDLAKKNPGWRFTGVDPAAAMLKGAGERLEREGLAGRVELFHGFLSEYRSSGKFDAVLCLLVMHFVKDGRKEMFQDMASRLKPGGILLAAEISCDFGSPGFPELLKQWQNMHASAGMPKENLGLMENVLRNQLAILAPAATGRLIEESGFSAVVPFFQALFIHGWLARK